MPVWRRIGRAGVAHKRIYPAVEVGGGGRSAIVEIGAGGRWARLYQHVMRR